mmetsp:Transcript_18964/g.54134  ORF Transcript_18964/g.54134 Transcript_18964/m.54134 type:complete len:205 (+) Transcript_18964:1473-2087(+)
MGLLGDAGQGHGRALDPRDERGTGPPRARRRRALHAPAVAKRAPVGQHEVRLRLALERRVVADLVRRGAQRQALRVARSRAAGLQRGLPLHPRPAPRAVRGLPPGLQKGRDYHPSHALLRAVLQARRRRARHAGRHGPQDLLERGRAGRSLRRGALRRAAGPRLFVELGRSVAGGARVFGARGGPRGGVAREAEGEVGREGAAG